MHRHRARGAQGKRPDLKLRAGIVTVRGVRLALAFVAPSFLETGAGDALLARLTPYFPGLPIMLMSTVAGDARAYATFNTSLLIAELDLTGVALCDLDLDTPAPETRTLPF
jgi:hypothetical protein